MTPDPESVSIYDWAVTANLQPEPISVEVWRNLPEEFCRQVELVNGQVVRCEKPSRAHQAAATRITAMLDAAAEAHMERNPGTCLDTSSDFDVLLWEVPAATIRSLDAAMFDCAPNDLRPLPAFHMKVVVEVVSPGSRKADKLDNGIIDQKVFGQKRRGRREPEYRFEVNSSGRALLLLGLDSHRAAGRPF